MGFVDRMQEFYQDMDLLVIPSHFEPMGMVAVEAMACGIPVLATDVPGLNEVVKHRVNGWTCAPRSTRALIGAIEEILDMAAAERISIASQGTREARSYSLREFSQKLQRFYNSLNTI
jgi:glycosyltransferase involved in cell wall biosynthesis